MQDASAILHLAKRQIFHSLSPAIIHVEYSSKSGSHPTLSAARLTRVGGFLRSGLRFAHAAKSEVIRSGVEFSLAASTRDVARAVLVGAQKRASALHAFLYTRFIRIETIGW